MSSEDDKVCFFDHPYYVSPRFSDGGIVYFIRSREHDIDADDVYGPLLDGSLARNMVRFLNANLDAFPAERLPHVLHAVIRLALEYDTPLKRALVH